MAAVETIEIYNALKERLGEEPTRLLMKYIGEASMANVATKEDLLTTQTNLLAAVAKAREELAKQETAWREEIHKLRDELRAETFKLRTILYILIVLLLITNPKLIELLGKVLGIIK